MSTAFRHVGYGNRFEWIGHSEQSSATGGSICAAYSGRHLSNGIPNSLNSGADDMYIFNPAISGSEKERKVERIVSPIGDLCIYGQAHDQTGKVLQ